MSKTAMQELLNWLEWQEYDIMNHKLMDFAIRVNEKSIELLEIEKQQILSAYDLGKEQPSNSQLNPITYYNSTYKTN